MTTNHFRLSLPTNLLQQGELKILKNEFNLTVEHRSGSILVEGDQSTQSGKAIKACLEQRLLNVNCLQNINK